MERYPHTEGTELHFSNIECDLGIEADIEIIPIVKVKNIRSTLLNTDITPHTTFLPPALPVNCIKEESETDSSTKRYLQNNSTANTDIPLLPTSSLFDLAQKQPSLRKKAVLLSLIELIECLAGNISENSSALSKVSQTLDNQLLNWNQRVLEQYYPFCFVYGFPVEVYQHSSVVVKTIGYAMGVDTKGHFQFLGIVSGTNHDQSNWTNYFYSLKSRGIETIDVFIVSHADLKDTNRLNIYPNIEPTSIDAIVQNFKQEFPEAVSISGSYTKDIFSLKRLPKKHYERALTILSIIRESIQIKIEPLRVFPSYEAVLRTIGATLYELSEEWESKNNKYCDIEQYFKWKESNQPPQKK